MGKDLFDPFEDEKKSTEILDEDTDSTQGKGWGKLFTSIIVVIVILGLIGIYIIQKTNFSNTEVAKVITKSNYTKDGKRYLVNPNMPGGFEVVDLSIKEKSFFVQGITKDNKKIKIRLTLNYWPNQNYLDYQYEYFMTTPEMMFDIDLMLSDFVNATIGQLITENHSEKFDIEIISLQNKIQNLIDRKIQKAFVFLYFDKGQGESLIDYMDVDEINTEDSLETKMFERNKWSNHAYLIESNEIYTKYYIIEDFIRIGTVKIISVEKYFGE